ncbi:FecCD family ABC transporter permease [Desulfofustis glycolicus]|uniref:Iron complex transport system permease protein n=1 Tax=Desulfofustis glycolicus DSM 9705 TaxID=1121409 RepID=A0A1M5YUZ9_9BACT|nr:iron ABC transporter permease [Desulfofustis glycolicus]MCB2215828.1 iron ABC transporter permease [Desulfobulbaceae bacterium]SHI15403.1 iron complex transport system permease protein [Desulfofustis glycolicus DSM 9705]
MMLVLPLLCFFLALLFGRYGASPLETIKAFYNWLMPQHEPSTLENVIFTIRLPRVATAMLIGGGLSVSGACFQGIFRNPLVSPFILGVATGAGFGAAMAILLSGNGLVIQGAAFLFGMLAVALSYGMTRIYRTSSMLVMTLSGVIVGTFFSALISLVKYVADPYDKLPVIVFWLMGSLATISQKDFLTIIVPITLGITVIFSLRWKINVLSMGEEEARSLGLHSTWLTILLIMSATLITASAVAVSGVIGWVGLVIPHLARMIGGPDYRRLIPLSMSLGACYLLLIDTLARNLVGGEVPLGILTATVGAPFFAVILKKGSLGWS